MTDKTLRDVAVDALKESMHNFPQDASARALQGLLAIQIAAYDQDGPDIGPLRAEDAPASGPTLSDSFRVVPNAALPPHVALMFADPAVPRTPEQVEAGAYAIADEYRRLMRDHTRA